MDNATVANSSKAVTKKAISNQKIEQIEMVEQSKHDA